MSDPAPLPAAADRNLLYGILALQMDFISRDALIAAMGAWVLDKTKPLGAILQEQRALTAEDHAALELLVRQHLRRHGDDPQRCLAAVPVPAGLQQIADPDVQASLSGPSAPVDTDLEPTGAYVPRRADGSRYRVLRPHAKGGLGEVFVAEDQELHREVALKEIQQEFAHDAHSRARFVMEAEITGRLEHPAVVPVYGLGQYADGRPYYAMRFIKGDTFKEALQRFHQADKPGRDAGERRLAFRELLGRFVDVCQAVAYAHSRGVLHRDLKPGNVMLGKYGETLLVDWGLAKPVGRPEPVRSSDEATLRPSSGSGVAATQAGTALGTPAYMSPEQAAGRLDLVGPASDIYGLGATLYSLLTGQPPFSGTDKCEVLRQVQRGEVMPPRKLKPRTPAALEAICLKAMALRPEDRYPMALELAADIEHWLADEPVRAYREPWSARAGRWMRRHKPAVAAVTAVAVVVLLLGAAGAWWLERQEAERQAELARQEGALRQEVAAALDQAGRFRHGGHFDESRDLLERAQQRLAAGGPDDLGRHVEQALADTALARRLDQARQRASTLVEGKWDSAGAERGYAAALREAGLSREGQDAGEAGARVRASAVRAEVVAALDDWAGLTRDEARQAWLLAVARAADPAADRDRLRRPGLWGDRAALERLAAGGSAAALSPQLTAVLARALHHSGGDAVPLLRAAQARYPDDFWLSFMLGWALAEAKQWDEAVGHYRAALALRPRSSAVHYNLGNALKEQGRVEEAVRHYQQALRLDPKDADVHVNLGNALRDMGRVEEAIGPYEEGVRLDPKSAVAHYHLGQALQQKGRFEEALASLKRAHELGSKQPGWRYPSDQWVKDAERLVRLDRKLAAVLRGEAQPAAPAERLALAQLCQQHKRLPAVAARFYAAAFAAEPKLAGDLQSGNRNHYNAACAAASAGCGKGEDAAQLGDKEKGGLRQQALDWLRADLAMWSEQFERDLLAAQKTLRHWLTDPDLAGALGAALTEMLELNRDVVEKTLRHWQTDPALAGVRGTALAQLPEAEQPGWQRLWEGVESLLAGKGLPGATLYDLAQTCSRLSATCKDPNVADRYAARAVTLLRQAAAKGFADVGRIEKDSALDGLHKRDDFKKLVRELGDKGGARK
jgi:tetratricopeptide (TPR) repeat protein/tRNA A-37 threonylcarbamoyl transferase component Bud32